MPPAPSTPSRSSPPAAVTGVQLMQGIGVQPAIGFWTDVWAHVVRRLGALMALAWLAVVAFFAVFAPLLASGHPLVVRELAPDGSVVRTSSPLWDNLQPVDMLLIAGVVLGAPFLLLPARWVGGLTRTDRGRILFSAALQAGASLVLAKVANTYFENLQSVTFPSGDVAVMSKSSVPADLEEGARIAKYAYSRTWVAIGAAGIVGLVFALLPIVRTRPWRIGAALAIALACWGATSLRWVQPLERFQYIEREGAGEISATYTLVPWSPNQRYSELNRQAPGTTLREGLSLEPSHPAARRSFILGTDQFGSDVLSQLLHACRLSISIGVVSTGIALMIGVTMGALMGYFGGIVDLVLFRVVEVFMAVPVLFLLIVAASVLPDELRTTYTMMAIIGCFSWTGMARYTRAEFLKLRNQDFVQAAQAVGLPLRSILFRHMLPNGVAPVLVDTSFAIAAAINIEAVLSFLNLGPVDQSSWGRMLSSATNAEGEFKWWLAVFPGLAIFLTILAYNLVGEALRDAIDPKLKKARV